jgi:hypothetical protein
MDVVLATDLGSGDERRRALVVCVDAMAGRQERAAGESVSGAQGRARRRSVALAPPKRASRTDLPAA